MLRGAKSSDLRAETGRPVTGDELHAYVDSQVARNRPQAGRGEVLLAHPECEATGSLRHSTGHAACRAGRVGEPAGNPQQLRPQLLIRQRLATPTAGSATDNPVGRCPLVPDPCAKAACPEENASPVRARPVLTD